MLWPTRPEGLAADSGVTSIHVPDTKSKCLRGNGKGPRRGAGRAGGGQASGRAGGQTGRR